MTDSRKTAIVAALYSFIHQRPSLDYGNYGDPVAYRAEIRSIGKDLQHARTLLRAVDLRDSITADDIIEASKHAFSGRLTITEDAPGTFTLDYCTGQYWPTEYRRAVCAVLSSAIWAWLRDKCMPEPDEQSHDWQAGHSPLTYRGMSAGNYLRASARREFGRGIASRWFN